MKYKIEIQCDNAAFEHDPAGEIASILQTISEGLLRGRMHQPHVADSNGNTVGCATFEMDYDNYEVAK